METSAVAIPIPILQPSDNPDLQLVISVISCRLVEKSFSSLGQLIAAEDEGVRHHVGLGGEEAGRGLRF